MHVMQVATLHANQQHTGLSCPVLAHVCLFDVHRVGVTADWEQQLRQYVGNHPQVVVVDRLDKIKQLHNRATMLKPLQGDGILLQQVTT